MNCPHCQKEIPTSGLVALKSFAATYRGVRIPFEKGDEFNPDKLGVRHSELISKLRCRLVGYGDITRSFSAVFAAGQVALERKVAMSCLEAYQNRLDAVLDGKPMYADDTEEKAREAYETQKEKCVALGITFTPPTPAAKEIQEEASEELVSEESLEVTTEEEEAPSTEETEVGESPRFNLNEITKEEIQELKKAELIELAGLINSEFAENIDIKQTKELLMTACVQSLFE